MPARRRVGALQAATAGLVRGEPPRPAVAPHHGPLRDPRQRDHAAADAGPQGRAQVRRLARGVAGPREPGRGAAGRRAATLAGPRLQQPRAAPAGLRAGGRAGAAAGRPRRAAAHAEGLRALPGIGPYTARAVLIFAHNDDLAAVDANVRRVLTHELGSRPRTSARRTSRRSPTPCCRPAAAATGTTRSWTTGHWSSRHAAPASPRCRGRAPSRDRAGRSARACSGACSTTGRSRSRSSPRPSACRRRRPRTLARRASRRDGLVVRRQTWLATDLGGPRDLRRRHRERAGAAVVSLRERGPADRASAGACAACASRGRGGPHAGGPMMRPLLRATAPTERRGLRRRPAGRAARRRLGARRRR